LTDQEILAEWERARNNDTQDMGFGVRGWYHEAYRSIMPGKKVMDIGCGMALSTLSFAEMGAHVTFVDIIPDNVELLRRLCRTKGIAAEFLIIDRFEDLDRLPTFDIVTAIGSLINAPLVVTRAEINRLKMHLRPGGRWLHLAYPKSRWKQEGRIDFSRWGEHTDGEGTPWMEYHDRDKMLWLFAPSEIRILFECEWHDHAYNWFDIELLHH
jgi:SAM-dependent methyltransferase